MTADLDSWLDAYHQINTQIRELHDAKQQIADQIQQHLGDQDETHTPRWHVTYRETITRRIDVKRVRAALEDHPNILEQVTVTSTSRTLRIKARADD